MTTIFAMRNRDIRRLRLAEQEAHWLPEPGAELPEDEGAEEFTLANGERVDLREPWSVGGADGHNA